MQSGDVAFQNQHQRLRVVSLDFSIKVCVGKGMRLLFILYVVLLASVQLLLGELVDVNKPTLYFLFLEERKFLNSHIWESFFHTSTNNSYNYQIFIHDNNPDRFVGPKNLHFKLLVNRTSITTCENTLNAMNSMLIEALSSSSVPHNEDRFMFLSSDFVPVKPLTEMFEWFFGGDSHTHHRPKSSFCIAPSKDWEINSADSTHHIVKHHQWIVLSRVDAAIVTDKHDAQFHFNERYSLLHEFDFDNRRCLDEYWYYAALFGEIVFSNPESSGLSSDTGSAAAGQSETGSLNLHSDVEQGVCHTYTFDDSYKPASPFVKGIRIGQGNHIKNSILYNPTLEFLQDLRKSSDFFFLRRIHSEDSNTHVRTEGGGSGGGEPLIKALAELNVLRITNHSGNSTAGGETKSTRSYASHARFRRGEGDNHGLKVLMVCFLSVV